MRLGGWTLFPITITSLQGNHCPVLLLFSHVLAQDLKGGLLLGRGFWLKGWCGGGLGSWLGLWLGGSSLLPARRRAVLTAPADAGPCVWAAACESVRLCMCVWLLGPPRSPKWGFPLPVVKETNRSSTTPGLGLEEQGPRAFYTHTFPGEAEKDPLLPSADHRVGP